MRQRFNFQPAKTLAGTAVILTVMFASETSLGGQASLERKAPAELEAMRQAFAGAVADKDRAAVAMLSSFPLTIESYGNKPKLNEQMFVRDKQYFDGWFFSGDAEVVQCLKRHAFSYQGTRKEFGAGLWYLDCNGNEYYFGLRAGKWAFVAYQNVNE